MGWKNSIRLIFERFLYYKNLLKAVINVGEKTLIVGKSLTAIKYKMFDAIAKKTILAGISSKMSKPTAKMVSI